MAELNDRDREVLRVLADGRANPMLIREKTGMDKGDINSVLVKLTRDGLARRSVRGLYEVTPDGRQELDEPRVADLVRDDLERALEHRDWNAVEDALARLKNHD